MSYKKNDWIVRIRAVVTKDVFAYDCTKEQAEHAPYEFGGHDEEVDQHDYKVLDIRENK